MGLPPLFTRITALFHWAAFMTQVNTGTSLEKPHGTGSVFRQMYRITANAEATFEQITRRLIDIGREHLGLPYGFLTRIEGSISRGNEAEGCDRDGLGPENIDSNGGPTAPLPRTRETGDQEPIQKILYASGEHPILQEGESCPLSEAYCRKTIQQEDLLSIQNAAAQGWDADPAYHRFDLGSYIGAKIIVEQELYGTFCFASHEPRGCVFSDDDEAFVELLTRWASYELERQRSRERVDQFAKLVTHDLKNPLNAAQMHLHLARRRLGWTEGKRDNISGEKHPDSGKPESGEQEPKIRKHLKVTGRALDRMEEIITNTHALTHGGNPLGPDDMEPVNLKHVAETSWEQISSEGATLQIETIDESDCATGHITEESACFLAHEGRLRQLFENLFRNAVDHAGPTVTVTVGRTEEGFFVADNGPGIPADRREQIFESGYSSTGKGTGFGLSIVDMIAHSHGWALLVTESNDGGARFEISGIGRLA